MDLLPLGISLNCHIRIVKAVSPPQTDDADNVLAPDGGSHYLFFTPRRSHDTAPMISPQHLPTFPDMI